MVMAGFTPADEPGHAALLTVVVDYGRTIKPPGDAGTGDRAGQRRQLLVGAEGGWWATCPDR